MKKLIIPFLMFSLSTFGQSIYQKDFSQCWITINENYSYFNRQNIDWNRVREIYQPLLAGIKNRNQFIQLLEQFLNELHNGHVSLSANLGSSNRIIPSGSDIFVEKKDNLYYITDIRKGFPASLCGLKPGMQVDKFNGRKIEGLLVHFLPKYTGDYTPDMYEFALNMLFAGTHDRKREITVIENGFEKNYYPDKKSIPNQKSNLLDVKIYNGNIGYIKINNSLGNNNLIPAFDRAMDSLIHTCKMILDLTETPGGGNSAVARAIMGRFIEKEMPFQKHEMDETAFRIKRSWVEYVTPRKSSYQKELLVMVGHWTGSMGEGIAIGFDGMERAKIVGTKMAGLLGAIEPFHLTNTKIGFQIPTERVFHINGTPREDFRPNYLSENINNTWEMAEELFTMNK